jgi:hypothetical protein
MMDNTESITGRLPLSLQGVGSGGQPHGESLGADARISRDPKRKSGFQIPAAGHGNRNCFAFAGLGVDVMASTDAPERPALRLNQPSLDR